MSKFKLYLIEDGNRINEIGKRNTESHEVMTKCDSHYAINPDIVRQDISGKIKEKLK